jgi:branched-chain amino acid transport system permease protein
MKRFQPFIVVIGGLGVGLLASAWISKPLTMTLLTQATFAAIFAVAVGFLIRQNGMVSFGHAAFYALPGYIVAILLRRLDLPAEFLILSAILVTTLLGFALGLIAVRLNGIAFSMLTLAVGQSLYVAATHMRDLTGGHDGIGLRLPRELFGLPLKLWRQPQGMFILSWCVLIVILTLIWFFVHSRWGRLTLAIRDNEERARFLGYRTLLPRALVFTASALIASVAGMLFAIYNTFISPDATHWTNSGAALVMSVLGGANSIWGPALGAYAYFFLKEFSEAYTTHWLSVIGTALIAISVAFPSGIAGLLEYALKPSQREKSS